MSSETTDTPPDPPEPQPPADDGLTAVEDEPPATGDEPADGAPAHPPGRHDGTKHAAHARSGKAALALSALGVVFGDIGTSPLYALQTVFTPDNHAVAATQTDVYGVISLVFWAITVVVSVKYITFILRADNGGEGGIMALTALIQTLRLNTRAKVVLVALGVFGASLFYGDGMITPAISVLSAVEGLKVAAPALGSAVVPITLVVLTMLFAIQRFGTGAVGRLFGPVMLLWFGVLGALGLKQIVAQPGVIKALSPSYGLEFFIAHAGIAFIALAGIVLVITGAEALYADMGHFGPSPIRRAWFFVVFPALTLNYLGQGSLILESPRAISSPFFLLIPHWGRIPMVVLATVATIIASQSVISGAFSVTRQAVQLGFLPRVSIRHTSEHEIGQVYAPAVNWALFVAIFVLVIGFGSSAGLASAYGVAVTGTFVLNTVLFLVVARVLWDKPTWMILAGAALFLSVELAFFAANLTKVVHGGWLPLGIAAAIFTLLITWQRGREIVTRNRTEEEGPLREFVEKLQTMDPPVHRAPGTAVFLNPTIDTTPLAMRANVEHNHTLHESALVASIVIEKVPHVADSERVVLDDLGYRNDGIFHLTLRFGFQDKPDVPAALRLACARDLEADVDVDEASYFVSHMTIRPTRADSMSFWRKKLFLGMSRQSSSPVEYFALPDDRTVTMGALVEL